MKRLRCSKCGKRFATFSNFSMHAIAKHHGEAEAMPRAPRVEHEPSMAELAVQAEIDIACGIPTDDEWLLG